MTRKSRGTEVPGVDKTLPTRAPKGEDVSIDWDDRNKVASLGGVRYGWEVGNPSYRKVTSDLIVP